MLDMDIGCLVIDGLMSGERMLSGLSSFLTGRGVRAEDYTADREMLHLSLQLAYQRVRRPEGVTGAAASGDGCVAALALAGQLPVDRLVLVEPRWPAQLPEGPRDLRRQAARLRGYAADGLPVCACDVLVLIAGEDHDLRGLESLRRSMCGCRFYAASLVGNVWNNRKELMKMAVYGFLRNGVLPKSLAENPEMCIIYE